MSFCFPLGVSRCHYTRGFRSLPLLSWRLALPSGCSGGAVGGRRRWLRRSSGSTCSASGWRPSSSKLAAAHATPDAPQWTDCTFDDDVAYVRSRTTGKLSAFVAVTIASENVSGAAANTSDAVGNLQAGTAVFRFDLDHWETDGRAILNLSPSEAVQHFRNDLEFVAEEFAHRS